ncbi:MAG: Peroxidase [uncultured Thiotrichaceae bacterium]|uniref:Peroxidase n=1 Tax=uncultured Thiotrichaceae bacterium TaxID=298394 RepID=A0A6S6TLX4_9GAMM|nr:MAG: Peroxidase [uncultured Thiotrichaceae bacterium]
MNNNFNLHANSQFVAPESKRRDHSHQQSHTQRRNFSGFETQNQQSGQHQSCQSAFPSQLNLMQHVLNAVIQLITHLISQLSNSQTQQPEPQPEPQAHDFRTMDGSGNNLTNHLMGSSGSAMMSILETDESRTLGSIEAAELANVRDISNAVAAQNGEETQNKKGLSDMFWLWGQFLDHDITLTPDNKEDRADIDIPEGDAFYDPFSTGSESMHFERSQTITDDNGNVVHINKITPYIDGSNIYGSDEETMNTLRSFEGGKLISSEDNLLPQNEKGHFLAGDVRVNENAGLTSMHTLWMREHNRVADNFSQQYPDWDDERIFQESRRVVIGELQAITYNEFLPNLLGNDNLSAYDGYDSEVSPQMSHAFSVAAFRLGHTMISPTLYRLDENGDEIAEGNLSLRDAFFQPDNVRAAGIDPILRGMASHTAQAVDPLVIDDLRNFLFGPPGAGGHDLAALNTQRGRDHGLPSLNDAREQLGLAKIESFDDPAWKGDYGQKLAQVYDSPDDVDLWIGGLAETASGDSLVGDTFTLILQDQFERLRDADRFWYEKEFSSTEVSQLNTLKLSDVISRNTDIKNIQENAMVARPYSASTDPVKSTTNTVNTIENTPVIINEPGINSIIRSLDNIR